MKNNSEVSFEYFTPDDDYPEDIFSDEDFEELSRGDSNIDITEEDGEQDHVSSDTRKYEEELLGGTPDDDNDMSEENIREGVDQTSLDSNRHASKKYIDGLIAVAEGVGGDDDDLDNALENQRITNLQLDAFARDTPDDIMLLDEPRDLSNKKLPMGHSGDEKTMSFLKMYAVACTTAIAVILVFVIAMALKPEPEIVATPPESTQPQGDVISQALDNDNSENQSDLPPKRGADDEEEAGSGSSDGEIKYELISEGGVKTVSVSYINGSGSKESETGVTLPWSKSISSGDSITPHFAANPGERGTLTCKIYRGDKKIAEDTASGENASVECIADE